MAQTTPGTFIPHDTVAPVRPRSRSGLNDLLLLLSIVFVVASGALGAGVFLYGQYLTTQQSSKADQLKSAEAAFEPSLIQQITRLDDRMHAADTILANHVAPTAFFQALSASTLKTVSFQTLDYSASDPQHITIKMQGIAQSVNSIALQDDLFSKSGVIASPIFSNIARQPDGVHFDLTASVNPAAINFVSLVTATQQGSASQGQQQTQQTQTSSGSQSPFGAPSGTTQSGGSQSSQSNGATSPGK